MTRLSHRYVVLCGEESTYGIEASPLDAIAVQNMLLRPMVLRSTEQPSLLSTIGNGALLTGHRHVEVSFSVPLSLPQTSSEPPYWEPLLKACGWYVKTTSNERTYTCHTPSEDSLTIYVHRDGSLHKILGARGNASLHILPSELPRFDFSFQGLYKTPADEERPAVSRTDWGKMLPSIPSRTIMARFYDQNVDLSSLSINMGGEISILQQSNHEEVHLLNRYPSGSLTISDVGLATKNWFNTIEEEEMGELLWKHGMEDVQIFLKIPRLQLIETNYGDIDNLQTRTMNFHVPMSYISEDFLVLKIKHS